jgi:creatinine amidohydrolase/Fe(II)-dependent formamide hydrolase-like protein
MKTLLIALAVALAALPTLAQKPGTSVEIELLTWPEIQNAIQKEGKTTVLLYSGGTEQRGPQGVTNKHTVTAHYVGRQIAQRLGNALLAPVLPYSVDRPDPKLPGTIGVSGPLYAALIEELAEQLIDNGFKNVVLLSDNGGGQRELGEVAKKLDEKWSGKGVRVVHAPDVYRKAGADSNAWLTANNLPVGSHAGIKDTSELLFLGADRGYVRTELLPTAVSDAARSNGISGDARKSSAEIGKKVIDIKIEVGVAQIRTLLAAKPGG